MMVNDLRRNRQCHRGGSIHSGEGLVVDLGEGFGEGEGEFGDEMGGDLGGEAIGGVADEGDSFMG